MWFDGLMGFATFPSEICLVVFIHSMQLFNLTAILALFLAVPSALAGVVVIGSPSGGSNVTAGSTIAVDIQKYVRFAHLPRTLVPRTPLPFLLFAFMKLH